MNPGEEASPESGQTNNAVIKLKEAGEAVRKMASLAMFRVYLSKMRFRINSAFPYRV